MSSRRTATLLPLLFALILATGRIEAEHRVALLIDTVSKNGTSLESLRHSLEERGFRCQTLLNPDPDSLKRSVQAFARTTPVQGTALLHFRGPVNSSSRGGALELRLAGAGEKRGNGPSLGEVFRDLRQTGGSRWNLVVLDTGETPEIRLELPPGCALARTDGKLRLPSLEEESDLLAALGKRARSWSSALPADLTLEGRGSVAISPPDRFVEGERAGDEWVNSRGMVFCWCPPGTYLQGSPDPEPGRYADEQLTEVTIRHGFWISKYEATIGLWSGKRSRNDVDRDKNLPVTMISQSKDTIARKLRPLTKEERERGSLPEAWEYALPDEDQWEYAARAGTTTRWSFGDELELLPEHANFGDRSYRSTGGIYTNAGHRLLDDGFAGLAPVGQLRPNPWGLHDVHGNVAEWCDPPIVRGGSWVSEPRSCRSAHRLRQGDRDKRDFVGARFIIRRVESSGDSR